MAQSLGHGKGLQEAKDPAICNSPVTSQHWDLIQSLTLPQHWLGMKKNEKVEGGF